MRPEGGAATEAGATGSAAVDGDHHAPPVSRRTFRFRRRTAASNLSRQTYGAGGAAAGLSSAEGSANVGMGLETDSTLLPPCYPKEGLDQRLARTQGLRESLAITRACAEEAAAEATAECVAAVSDFINGWGFGAGGGRHGDMGKNDLIPLAIVNAGLHLADRVWAAEKIRRGLAGTARNSCSEVVVVLRCQECTTVESTLSTIRVQCLALGGIASRRPLFMDSLGDWYDSMFPPGVAPGRRWRESVGEKEGSGSAGGETRGGNPEAFAERGKPRRRPPVVVLIEDVEGMEKQVLRDVLTILAQPPVPASSSSNGPIPARGVSGPRGGRCGRGFPLALVALASMGMDFPMERLSCSSARQVSVRNFALPSAALCVDSLLQKLFVQGRLPVEMGSRAVLWMHRSFVESHQSLATVCRQIQRAMLEHFTRPASYICLQNCPAWLERLRYTNRREEARAYFALTFMSDCRRMPPESMNSLLGGVFQAMMDQQASLSSTGSQAAEEAGKTRPVLSQQQATDLLGKALADQAAASLRLWFLHEVVTAVSDPGYRRHGERGQQQQQQQQQQGQHRRPRSHGNINPSPSHLMVLIARGSKAYFKEITKIAGALGTLPPHRVMMLLRQLLKALATARGTEASPSAIFAATTTVPGSSVDGQPPPAAQEGEALSSTPRGRTYSVPSPNDTPPAVAGLDSREAAYLRSSVEKLLRLWTKADDEGWAQSAGELWMSEAVSPPLGVVSGVGGNSAVGGDSAVGTGDCGAVGRGTVTSSSSSRGQLFLKRALDQGAAAFSMERRTGSDNVQDTEGSAPREPSRGNEQEHSRPQEHDEEQGKALWRACLGRELQVLFLHVMGEARECPLVEGESAELPPPLSSKAILREGYRFDRPNAMQASLCPQGRAIVDEAMVTGARGPGAGAGMPRPSADSSGIAQHYPLSDTCLLYACYRGHGKVIDRSDWFADFRRASTRHNPPQQLMTGGAGPVAAPATETASHGHRTSDPAKLRARFAHASQELELLGYVKSSKRRKRDKGGTSGPRGSVTRLVYAYTMEGEAL